MKYPRVYGPLPLSEEAFSLDSESSFHIGVVLRMGAGERFVLSDGLGRDFLLQIVHSGSRKQPLSARFIEELEPQAEPRASLVLAVALAKGERYERLIEKAAELSVARFVPLLTTRSLGEERGQRWDRWQRLARESSALAGRSRWMQVSPLQTFGEVLKNGRGVLFSQGGQSWHKSGHRLGVASEVWLVVGPEGGFTDQEVEQAQQPEWSVVGLGPRNLRVETAAIVGVTLALLENGEFEERANGTTQS